MGTMDFVTGNNTAQAKVQLGHWQVRTLITDDLLRALVSIGSPKVINIQ
jgi:hypothetical protein